MKFFVLSDNNDTAIGMRLAGIDGIVVRNREDLPTALRRVMHDPEIGVILITQKLMDTYREKIMLFKLTYKRPLIVEIPDRHGHGNVSANIERYVGEAIGIKL